MILRSAGILLSLLYCSAENNGDRWSKAERDVGQGEWVPLNQEHVGINSAINHHFSHGILQGASSNSFPERGRLREFLPEEPPRISFLHSLNNYQFGGVPPPRALPQPTLQQPPPLTSQLMPQILNQQLGGSNFPIYNRVLHPKQPAINSNYYPEYNIVPGFNSVQNIKNSQYSFGGDPSYDNTREGKYNEQPSKQSEVPLNTYTNDGAFNSNVSSLTPDKKEEVQILYVPVEMLRQRERFQESDKNVGSRPIQSDVNDYKAKSVAPKETKKFRHPIQPLSDQVPASHLKTSYFQNPLTSPTTNEEEGSDYESRFNNKQPSLRHKPAIPTNTEYSESNDDGVYSGSISNNKQYEEESVAHYKEPDLKSTNTRRTPSRENSREKLPNPTLPPPNQPPLSVFMESTTRHKIGDVLNLLKDSETIPVLDSVGPDAPQVFVGPSNLKTPQSYIKYELPYLSSLTNNNAPSKLSEVPFFVAPLNFQPPPGFAKIPFPPPHIGSVVLSNSVYQHSSPEPIPTTQPSNEQYIANHREAFTIPADISSISPQLPSLINSLQEGEYLGTSSTESLKESTEEPPTKYKRPVNSRRPTNRGSHRARTTSTTTQKPYQRRPSHRQNQRLNQNSESSYNPPPSEENYPKVDKFPFEANRKPIETTLPEPVNDGDKNKFRDINHGQSIHSNSQNDFEQAKKNIEENAQRDFRTNNYDTSPTNPPIYSDGGNWQTKNREVRPEYHQVQDPYEDKTVTQFSQGTKEPTSQDQPSYDSNIPREYLHQTKEDYQPQLQQYKPLSSQPHHESHFDHNAGPISSGEGVSYESPKYQSSPEDSEVNSQGALGQQTRFESPHQPVLSSNPGYISEYQEAKQFNKNTNGVQPQEHNVKSNHNSYSENNDEYSRPTVTEGSTNHKEAHLSGSSFGSNYQDYTIPSQKDTISANNNEKEENTEVEEKPSRVRGRTRTKGQNKFQPASQRYQERENDQKTRYTSTNENNSDHYRTNTRDSKTDVTTEQSTTSLSRKYLHGRGRRPSRPTVSTTPYPTTETSHGTTAKYLIRTRKPQVGTTKLQTGRGRIRKPTTPTTTTLATPVESSKAVLPEWSQLNTPDDLPLRTVNTRFQQNSDEYRAPLRYNEQGTNENIYTPKQDDTNQGNYPRTPNYYYEDEEEQNAPRKHQVVTESPLLTTSHGRFHKQNSNRNNAEERKPYYQREQERTPINNLRDKESRLNLPVDYQDTQKPQYVRDYEAKLRPQASHEREIHDAEYTRVQETSPMPQYSGRYDGSETLAPLNEYATSKNKEYAYEHATTPMAESLRSYDTANSHHQKNDNPVRKSHRNQGESSERTVSSSAGRPSNNGLRRRPTLVTRGEIQSAYKTPEPTKNKNSDSDFWNESVTIQQSQSYVYNPEESETAPVGTTNVKDKTKAEPSHDYTDLYYNSEGNHQSSDQSPFPSNEQQVTYFKTKPSQETGKANQYPEKIQSDITPVPDKNEQEKDLEKERDEGTSEATQPSVSSTKGWKRRGAWVRVRVKKPKDVFQTAESQRFGTLRENSLESNFNEKHLDKHHEEESVSNKTEEATVDVTTKYPEVDIKPKEITPANVSEKVETTTTQVILNNPEDIESSTENVPFEVSLTTLSSNQDEVTVTEGKKTEELLQSDYQTSTTTEISLETEICYKGKCIKTKRRKQQD